MTDGERYQFIKQRAYKILFFAEGQHFQIEMPAPNYSPVDFDLAIDHFIEALKKVEQESPVNPMQSITGRPFEG